MIATRFVMDASAAIAWLLNEPQCAPNLGGLLRAREAIVPGNWSLEVCNGIRKAERTGRITLNTLAHLQQAVLGLPVAFVRPSVERDWSIVLPLARRSGLSIYDAAYLELAMRERSPLLTFDAALKQSAAGAGVECL